MSERRNGERTVVGESHEGESEDQEALHHPKANELNNKLFLGAVEFYPDRMIERITGAKQYGRIYYWVHHAEERSCHYQHILLFFVAIDEHWLTTASCEPCIHFLKLALVAGVLRKERCARVVAWIIH